jgi:acyl carrier protein
MDKLNFLEMMDEILECQPGTIRAEDQLADLEDWDSLALMSFMAKVNSAYGIILSPKQIVQCKTVKDLEGLTAGSPT